MANETNKTLWLDSQQINGPVRRNLDRLKEYVDAADVALAAVDTAAALTVAALPRGRVAYAQITADSATTSGTTALDIIGLSVTWTAVAGRRYRVSVNLSLNGVVAADLFHVYIRNGSTTVISRQEFHVAIANQWGHSNLSVVETPAAGSVTRNVTLQRSAGTGLMAIAANATYPAYILVEDIGT